MKICDICECDLPEGYTGYICEDCEAEETLCDNDGWGDGWGDDELIDGVGFANPGGRSALRAATANNPRNCPCPTCKRGNMLTPIDVAHDYQCDDCADEQERGGY